MQRCGTREVRKVCLDEICRILQHQSEYSSNPEGKIRMQLRLLGTESGKEGCPALYATDRGTYVVQGKRVTDPEAIAGLVDVREDEFYVEIPAGLLRYAQG
jgi:hypothetical protein